MEEMIKDALLKMEEEDGTRGGNKERKTEEKRGLERGRRET